MNLRDWLYINKVNNLTVARDTGYSIAAVQIYLNFRGKMPLKFAKAAELLTRKELSAESILEWSEKGILERRELEAQIATPKKTKEKLDKIMDTICDSCRKKLTKEGIAPKK